MVQVRKNSNWNFFFFIFTFFSSDHLLSSSMKSCYFSAIHLTICLIVQLNMQRQHKWGRGSRQTSTHAQNNIWNIWIVKRVEKLSFPVICQFSHYRNSIYLKPVLGFFLVVGLNSGCSSRICSHSAEVFMRRALCGLILVWLDCYWKLSKSHKIPSTGFTFPVGIAQHDSCFTSQL